MKIFILGFMGCGKSTLGRKLALKMGMKWLDLDEEIEQNYHMPVKDIFAQKGENWFREKESDVLRNFEASDNLIISVGGGTPCFYSNMDWMNANGLTVYLQMTANALFSRLNQGTTDRPLLSANSDKLLEFITKLLKKRKNTYEKAQFVVDGMNVDVESLMTKLNC